ncbi:hypothetical protein [Proteus penneri]|uniref:hypothetical protein n=1 Tax=Proteus penneri TaxID=102862 RepID=UPI003C2CEAED
MKNSINATLKQDARIFGASFNTLVSRVEERSVRMPSGLTREQRRQWAAKTLHQKQALSL